VSTWWVGRNVGNDEKHFSLIIIILSPRRQLVWNQCRQTKMRSNNKGTPVTISISLPLLLQLNTTHDTTYLRLDESRGRHKD